MEIEVRSAVTSDLGEIVAIYNHYVERTAATFDLVPLRTEERIGWFEEHSQPGPYRLLVATDGPDRLVGWASSSPFRPRPAYRTTVESSIYCHPEALGRGVGTSLYSALLRALASEDLARVVAGIALPNAPSVALHRKFGFRPVGVFTRVGRKFGRYWDVAWFEHPLSESASETAAGGSDAPREGPALPVPPEGPDRPSPIGARFPAHGALANSRPGPRTS